MRFSDAVRAGSRLGKQLFGRAFDGWGNGCVMGAAAIGAGFAMGRDLNWPMRAWVGLKAHYPNLMANMPRCHVCHCELDESRLLVPTVWGQMVHLNNDHRWPREQIADWYEANFEKTDAELIEKTVVEVLQGVKEPVNA